MFQLEDGFWVVPAHITVIKAVDKDRCSLWVTGQSALEGFVLDRPAEEIVELVNDILYGPEEHEEDDEHEEEMDAGNGGA